MVLPAAWRLRPARAVVSGASDLDDRRIGAPRGATLLGAALRYAAGGGRRPCAAAAAVVVASRVYLHNHQGCAAPGAGPAGRRRRRAPWSIRAWEPPWFGPACIREIPVADICDPVSV
eukprot:COSAG01_NODE_13322_length_1601_cov_2.064581_2_plen_117_part_01